MSEPTVHATAVLVGRAAVLIRGPSGSGKSQLALALIRAAHTGMLRFARLIGDDRVVLESQHGRLLVRPAVALAGLIEVRGQGIRRVRHEPAAVVGLVIDLAANATRMPEPAEAVTVISGIVVPRLAVPAGWDGPAALAASLAAIEGCGI